MLGNTTLLRPRYYCLALKISVISAKGFQDQCQSYLCVCDYIDLVRLAELLCAETHFAFRKYNE